MSQRNIREHFFSPTPIRIWRSSHPAPSLPWATTHCLALCNPFLHSLPSALRNKLLTERLYHQQPFMHTRIKQHFTSASQHAYQAPKRFFLLARKETTSSRRRNSYEQRLRKQKQRSAQALFPLFPQQSLCAPRYPAEVSLPQHWSQRNPKGPKNN